MRVEEFADAMDEVSLEHLHKVAWRAADGAVISFDQLLGANATDSECLETMVFGQEWPPGRPPP